MKNHLIAFDALDWISPAKGIRYKRFVYGNNVLRLLEFSEGFAEPERCTKGHAGYVLEGSISVEFDGGIEKYRSGDIFFIPEGKEDRHKAILGKGQRTLLLMFEIEQSEQATIDYCI